MSSHKILVGLWKKKKWSHKDVFKFIHDMTPAQLSFCRHVVAQNLGGKGHKYWGHHDFGIKLPQSKESLEYFMKATEHPRHIVAEKMAEHKDASGIFNSIGKAVVRGAKAVGRGAARAGKYMLQHSGAIARGLGTALQLGTTGVQIAAQVGLLDPESDATLLKLADVSQTLQDAYHAEEEENKTTESPKDKKGSGIQEIMWSPQLRATMNNYYSEHPAQRPRERLRRARIHRM